MRSNNLAFIGQVCELSDDVVFTVEYSIRSAQTAVYSLLRLNRTPPPIYKGHYDPRVLLKAFLALHDKTPYNNYFATHARTRALVLIVLREEVHKQPPLCRGPFMSSIRHLLKRNLKRSRIRSRIVTAITAPFHWTRENQLRRRLFRCKLLILKNFAPTPANAALDHAAHH